MKKKEKLQVSDRQRKIIHRLIRNGRMGTDMVKRLQVVLLASEGMSNYAINKVNGMQKNWIGVWRDRWEEDSEKLMELEQNHTLLESEFENHILQCVSDQQRSGRPLEITLVQKNQIVAMACDKPTEHGVPVTNWSLDLMVRTIKKKKIAENISRTSVHYILKKTSTASNE